MKAVNRKTPHHGYRVQNGNRLSFQGRWYVCPGLLSRLRGREFDLYYDRRDVGVLYIFVGGEYVGEAYCPQLMGGRVSEWEARAMRKHDEEQAKIAREQGLPVRARIQDEARAARLAEVQRFEQVNRPVNGTANAQIFIPPSLQFRRRFDKLAPFCRIASHTSEEVRDILATLETVY